MKDYKSRKEFDAHIELIERRNELFNHECKQWLNDNPRKRKVPSNVTSNFNVVSYRNVIDTAERLGWERLYYHFSDYLFECVGDKLYNTI